MKALFLNTKRECYSAGDCSGSMTIMDLISALEDARSEHGGDTKVYFCNDGGCTYGSITGNDIVFRWCKE